MVDFQFPFAETAFGPLQQVVNLLGDLEELGFLGVYDDALGGDAQGVEQRNHGLQDLGHTAADGRCVQVQHARSPQFGGYGCQFVSEVGVHIGAVGVQGNGRVVELQIHSYRFLRELWGESGQSRFNFRPSVNRHFGESRNP